VEGLVASGYRWLHVLVRSGYNSVGAYEKATIGLKLSSPTAIGYLAKVGPRSLALAHSSEPVALERRVRLTN
jgi:hypothetical protein